MPILGAVVSVLSLAGVVWWALGQEPPTLPDTPARWAALAGAIALYGVATCVRGERWQALGVGPPTPLGEGGPTSTE